MESAFSKFLGNFIQNGLEFFGLYYSSYRAFVSSNEDPLHLNRLQLIIPHITGDQSLSTWVIPKNNFSGSGYGSQVLPRIGDLVWVTFERGKISKPLWEHGYFGKDEKPNISTLESYNNFWFRTPKGHLVELDDDNKVIRLTDITGNILEMNPQGISEVVTGDQTLSHGTLNKSKYSAVLGEINVERLNDITDALTTLNDALNTYNTSLLAIAVAVPIYSPMAPSWTALKAVDTALKATITAFQKIIPQTLSKVNSLD